jgi:glycosyltransferase involved in cell wall biosynthesis
MQPLVSVIIPIYKAEDYIVEALRSVMDQTYKNLEIILINDQSPDRSIQLAEELAANDPRVQIVENRYEKGIVGALNTGLELATGELIARMDGDDVCFPDRIERQVKFMDEHPEIAVSSGSVEVIGKHSGLKFEYPTDPEVAAIYPLLNSPLAHPATILRADFFQEHSLRYDYEYQYGEDIDLWQRVLDAGGQIGNLAEVILKYRTHNTNVTVEHASRNSDLAQKVRLRILNKLGLNLSEPEVTALHLLAGWTPASSRQMYLDYLKLINEILGANAVKNIYHQSKLAHFLHSRLHHLTVAGNRFIPFTHLAWGVVNPVRFAKDNVKVSWRKLRPLLGKVKRKVLG